MGTKYYVGELKVYECLKNSWEEEATCHKATTLGMSRIGWCFSLNVIPERNLTSPDDWSQEILSEKLVIWNEYFDLILLDHMLTEITCGNTSSKREKVGENNCISHAFQHEEGKNSLEGTWDLIENME